MKSVRTHFSRSTTALMQTIKVLDSLGAGRYRILLSIILPKPSRDGEEARATIEEVGLPLFNAGIRRLIAFQKVALTGVTVKDVNNPRAISGWDDYLQMGKEVLS